jgi:hypothetical protein
LTKLLDVSQAFRDSICCIIAFALVRRSYFAPRANGISNDQDVMDYSLNKGFILANALHFETKNFIHNYLINTSDWSELAQEWRNHRFSYNETQKFQENQNMRYGPKSKTSHRTAWIHPKIYRN